MKRILLILALLALPLSARAGDFTLDLLAGQSLAEGTDRHDGAYAFGLDYHAPRGVVVAGRVIYLEIERGSFANGFSVAVEKHFGHSAFSPYVTAGTGPVILHLPGSGDDSYMAYSFGGGFDYKFLTVEAQYVRDFEGEYEDAIQALVGVRLNVGK